MGPVNGDLCRGITDNSLRSALFDCPRGITSPRPNAPRQGVKPDLSRFSQLDHRDHFPGQGGYLLGPQTSLQRKSGGSWLAAGLLALEKVTKCSQRPQESAPAPRLSAVRATAPNAHPRSAGFHPECNHKLQPRLARRHDRRSYATVSRIEYLAAGGTVPLDRCCHSSNGTGLTGSCSKSRSA